MGSGILRQDSVEVPSQWLINALVSRSIKLSAIEAVIGRKLDQDRVEGTILPLETYYRLFEWGADATDDPDLGLHIAEGPPPVNLGLLSYLLQNSPTLGTWVKNLVKYHRIFARDVQVSFEIEDDEICLVYEPIYCSIIEQRQDIVFAISCLVLHIRRIINPRWAPLRCSFRISPPKDEAEMSRVLGGDLSFSQDNNGFVFSSRYLELPIKDSDAVLYSILKTQADAILETLGQTNELVHRLRLLIAANLSDQSFGMHKAADVLNMSIRKLHRELAARGSSFREIRDGVIYETARTALANSDAPIKEIAHRLGYSETSAFTRAFKRIGGTSPVTYRGRDRAKRS